MVYIILGLLLVITASGWAVNKINTMILSCYILKKGYPAPTAEELEECRRYIERQIVAEILRR